MAAKNRAIKKVDDEVWRLFKAEAAEHGKDLGEFFGELVREHWKRESRDGWEEIFSHAGSLGEEEKRDVKRMAKMLRHGFELREHDTSA